MTRWLLLPVLLVLAGTPAVAKDEPRAPMDLQGAPLIFRPPSGDGWKVNAESLSPGQWHAVFRRGDTVLTAMVVPFNPTTPTDPVKLLFRAVQGLKQREWNLGIDGAIGMPGLGPLTLMGHDGAEGRIDTRRKGRRCAGRARILVSGAHWGFAWGLFPLGSPASERDAVDDFVRSMVPKAPSFFTPHFSQEKRMDEIHVRPTGEPPITHRQLLALERVVQMAAGGPMCMGRRDQLRRVLIADADSQPRRYRDGMRDLPAMFERGKMKEAEQRKLQLKVGETIYHGYLSRYLRQDANAINFVHIWNASRFPLAKKPTLLRQRAVDNLMEMLAFLASLAADRALEITAEQRDAFRKARVEAWPEVSEGVRAAWNMSGHDWLRLRYAWDQADPSTRNTLRRAVVEAFATPEARKALDQAKGPRGLKQWMEQHGPIDMARILEVGAAMTQPERDAVLHKLTPWPTTVPLGW